MIETVLKHFICNSTEFVTETKHNKILFYSHIRTKMLTGPYLTAFEMRGGKANLAFFKNIFNSTKILILLLQRSLGSFLFYFIFLMDFIRNEDVVLRSLGLSQNIDVWQ